MKGEARAERSSIKFARYELEGRAKARVVIGVETGGKVWVNPAKKKGWEEEGVSVDPAKGGKVWIFRGCWRSLSFRE
jgi:hypothetical protein